MAKNSGDNLKNMQEGYSKINQLINDEMLLIKGINAEEEKRRLISEQISNIQKVINEAQKEVINGDKKAVKILTELRKQQKDLIDKENELSKSIKKTNQNRQTAVDLTKQLSSAIKNAWSYLQLQDKVIKSTILNLGMSGAKAEMMRTSFEGSAMFVARLGGTLADIQSVMEGYADETGRARALTSEMVNDITLIGKGTGLGIEQATRLSSQFELMGIDAKLTMNYVQGVVDTSERMGINTTKVLKNVSDNFKKLNTYNFQQGVKGFAQMAEYAEKFKVDIGDALNAADTARTLEGAIGMVAQLQVMGGEFAKLDMFETLYLSRNDPAKLQSKIGDLTKGLVTLRKNSDGTFEKFISPADRDRLNQAGKALGISSEKMTEMSLRAFDVNKMAQQLQGIGLTDREKELVQGAATFNSSTGKFEVMLSGKMKDISNLTKEQANAFANEQVLLIDRAKNAQTFNETFKATIEILKSSLLPLLKGVNWLLEHTVKPLADMAASGWGGLAGAATILAGAGATWWLISRKLGDVAKNFVDNSNTGVSRVFGVKNAAVSTSNGKTISGLAEQRRGIGAGAISKGQGIKNLGTGAGLGAAAVGMGAGVALAAVGISKLADSMSKLTDKQAENLKSIATTLAITFPAAAIGIGLVAAVAAPAAVPLLALGAALLMIGGAIGIASAGIGVMGMGLSKMIDSASKAGNSLYDVAGGVGAIGLAMAGSGLASIFGGGAMVLGLQAISKQAPAIAQIGEAFKQINTVMSGSKEDFIAIEKVLKSISNINTSGGGMLTELATLLKSPLKVEFANNGKVTLTNDITLNIDGQRFMNKTYDVDIAIRKHESLRQGK